MLSNNKPQTQEQKELLAAVSRSRKLDEQSRHKLKVMLENGELWHMIGDLIDDESVNSRD